MSTAAFVMGIDGPNVDVVVWIECPPFLEEKFKQFGRAGQDGPKLKLYNSVKYIHEIL